jgi:hypothetical protein
MARKKKNGFGIVFLIVAGLLLYNFVFDNNGNSSSTSGPGSSSAPESPSNPFASLKSYAAQGTLDDWPNLANSTVTDLQDKLAKNYYVILDDSGSMKSDVCASGHSSRLAAAIEALARFAEGLPPEANFGVMSFDRGKYTEHLPLGRRGRDNLRNLAYQTVADGGTPLLEAITRGYKVLTEQAVAQLGYGEYNLVIITDGAASERQHPDAILRKILKESPVNVHTIGFCIGTSHVLNQPDYLSYRPADNVEALTEGLRDVLAEAPAFSVSSFDN